MKTTKIVFRDDGFIPNSSFPVIIHHQAINLNIKDPKNVGRKVIWDFVDLCVSKEWKLEWLWKIYKTPHYHSTTHEALVVSHGHALLRIGGHREQGGWLTVSKGDAIVLPAGVAHQAVKRSPDFQVFGFYPVGSKPWDLLRGTKKQRHRALLNLAQLREPPEFLRK